MAHSAPAYVQQNPECRKTCFVAAKSENSHGAIYRVDIFAQDVRLGFVSMAASSNVPSVTNESRGSSNSHGHGSACPGYEGMRQELAENLRLHQNGTCRPCVAFAFREGGCFKGEMCSHCHFCTAEEAAERRKHLQSIARRRRRMRRLEAELNQGHEQEHGHRDRDLQVLPQESGTMVGGCASNPAEGYGYQVSRLSQVPLASALSAASALPPPPPGIPWASYQDYPGHPVAGLGDWYSWQSAEVAGQERQARALSANPDGSPTLGNQSFWL